MFSNPRRVLVMIATGCLLLQAPGCDLTLQAISTGLLAALTGITFSWLATYNRTRSISERSGVILQAPWRPGSSR